MRKKVKCALSNDDIVKQLNDLIKLYTDVRENIEDTKQKCDFYKFQNDILFDVLLKKGIIKSEDIQQEVVAKKNDFLKNLPPIGGIN